MTTQSFWIQYGEESLLVQCSKMVADNIEQALAPFFSVSAQSSKADALITIQLIPEPMQHKPTSPGQVLEVDTSLYKHLASSGRLWGDENHWQVHIELTDSWFSFDRNNQSVVMYQPDAAYALTDIVRLIKGLITTAVEQKGAIQLHASAVVTDAGATVILGDMWQGKTTLLLELLANFRVKQLSCDTIVINKALSVRGWPSPFSMSHGTMADHPQLHPYIPKERLSLSYDALWKEAKKSVLTSQQVTALFETSIEPACEKIETCIIARFNPDGPIGTHEVNDIKALEAILRLVYLGSRDPIYHNWHRYIVCDNETLERNISQLAARLLSSVQILEFNWAPSAESLFKRISSLAPAHKTLGALLY